MPSTAKRNASSKCLDKTFNLSMNTRKLNRQKKKSNFFSTSFSAGRLSPRKKGFNTQEFDKFRTTPLGVFTFKQFNKNEDNFKVNKYLCAG